MRLHARWRQVASLSAQLEGQLGSSCSIQYRLDTLTKQETRTHRHDLALAPALALALARTNMHARTQPRRTPRPTGTSPS